MGGKSKSAYEKALEKQRQLAQGKQTAGQSTALPSASAYAAAMQKFLGQQGETQSAYDKAYMKALQLGQTDNSYVQRPRYLSQASPMETKAYQDYQAAVRDWLNSPGYQQAKNDIRARTGAEMQPQLMARMANGNGARTFTITPGGQKAATPMGRQLAAPNGKGRKTADATIMPQAAEEDGQATERQREPIIWGPN